MVRAYAEDLCDCLSESEYQDLMNGGQLAYYIYGFSYLTSNGMDEATAELGKCMLPVLKDMRAELGDMDDDERRTFLKQFANGVLYSECGDALFDRLPVGMAVGNMDEIIEELEEDIERYEGRIEDGDDYNELCECIELMKEADSVTDMEATGCMDMLMSADPDDLEECDGWLDD